MPTPVVLDQQGADQVGVLPRPLQPREDVRLLQPLVEALDVVGDELCGVGDGACRRGASWVEIAR